jgi:Alpha-L-arabinofuranosidase B (ABFB) domain
MATCFLRSEAQPSHYLRHQCYRAKLSHLSDEQSRKDASLFQRGPLAPGVGPHHASFEAEHFPGYFLRVRGGKELWLDANDGSEAFRREATFRLVPGLANPMGVSLESVAFPGHFVTGTGMLHGHHVNVTADYSEHAR